MIKSFLIITCIFFAITLQCVASDTVANKSVSTSDAAASKRDVNTIDEFERQVREVAKRTAAEQKLKKERAQAAAKENLAVGHQSIQVFKYQRNGTVTFSDRIPAKTPYKVITYTSCYACSISSSVNWHNTKLHVTEFADAIAEASSLYNVNPAFVRAVIHAESAFNPLARSSKGAMGLMQLMPGTAKDMGVSDSSDPNQNIRGGVKYLANLLKIFEGDVSLATAAYNAGPGAVTRYKGIPPYEETRTYVKRVNILLQRYKSKMEVAAN